MFVGAVRPGAMLSELTHYVWVQIHALVAVLALREELALLCGVVVRALLRVFGALREVPTSNVLLVLGAFLSVLTFRLRTFSL